MVDARDVIAFAVFLGIMASTIAAIWYAARAAMDLYQVLPPQYKKPMRELGVSLALFLVAAGLGTILDIVGKGGAQP